MKNKKASLKRKATQIWKPKLQVLWNYTFLKSLSIDSYIVYTGKRKSHKCQSWQDWRVSKQNAILFGKLGHRNFLTRQFTEASWLRSRAALECWYSHKRMKKLKQSIKMKLEEMPMKTWVSIKICARMKIQEMNQWLAKPTAQDSSKIH